ncbi:hematopoietic SH2 domain-containing protein homolog isoform 2-T3 [Lycodopsis pacificus]
MMEQSQSSQEQHDAITWFSESQRPFVIRNGIIPEWFHGIISRNVAEELLMSKPSGYFLIRVSESRIGYSLSYRAEDCCRHFMIDALEDGHYIILGENRSHRGLQDMVDFHRRTPITPFSVVLTVPCGQPVTRNRCTAENPPSNQPPQVPARTSAPPLKQNQACIRTVSESPHTPTATEQPLSGNIQFAKNQEAKTSVVSNLKNLKKKFQKKRNTTQEYAEINMEATERSGTAGNEYHYITGQQIANAPPLSYACTDVRLTDGGLPYEYLPPAPFAPGF